MVLERLSWRVTRPNHASFRLLTVARRVPGEAVVVWDMPEPCKFPSLDSWQKRVLWTHEDIVLAPHPSRWSCAPHPVVGPVLHVGDTEKSPQAAGFESLGLFSEIASRVHVSQS